MRYLLDSNVFIQAKNLHYGFDFCPAFWDWIIEKQQAGVVYSIEKVADELRAGADELSDWADARRDLFLPLDDEVVPSLATVSRWASGAGYEPSAVSTFLQVADYYLIAHAHAHGITVVTHEVPAEGARKIKIPNACIAMQVPCISPYEMLRAERARFVLPA
ncbi:MAG: DUF4411 family protein [Actinobacteria bacterium]|nr:DUF4411 family protein [Actinomycetota bacterium]